MWVAFANAIFNDQSFNNPLTNNIVSFEQLGPVLYLPKGSCCREVHCTFFFEWQGGRLTPVSSDYKYLFL